MKNWKLGVVLALAVAGPLQARDAGELAWDARVEPVPGQAGQVELVFTTPIHEGWIVYASDFTPGEFGPRPAKVQLRGGGQPLQPPVSEGARAGSGRSFAGEYHYTYFAGQATFRQKVQLEPGAREVSGVLNGQSCFEESGLCTLFSQSFAIALE